MPTREQMHSLAQEIIHSYEERVAEIAQLQNTVETELQELFGSRAAMAQELRADLAKGVADRRRDVGGLLRDFDQAHNTMGRQMKAALAKGVADRRRDVAGLLRDFDQAHNTMGRQTKAALAKGVADRQRDVGSLLRDFDQAHNTMGRQTKAALAKGVADRQRDVGGLLRRFDRDLKAVRTVLAGGQAEWQKLAATMQDKRGALLAEVKAPEAPPPAVEEVPVAPLPRFEELPEAEAIARAEPIEVTAEIADLRDRVFEYLANRPDGTRMTVLEEEFGTARIQMARMLKSLMDDNKVEKRDLLYFAI